MERYGVGVKVLEEKVMGKKGFAELDEKRKKR